MRKCMYCGEVILWKENNGKFIPVNTDGSNHLATCKKTIIKKEYTAEDLPKCAKCSSPSVVEMVTIAGGEQRLKCFCMSGHFIKWLPLTSNNRELTKNKQFDCSSFVGDFDEFDMDVKLEKKEDKRSMNHIKIFASRGIKCRQIDAENIEISFEGHWEGSAFAQACRKIGRELNHRKAIMEGPDESEMSPEGWNAYCKAMQKDD